MQKKDISILTSASQFYSSLFDDLRRAQKSVLIQMYCIEQGAIADQFKNILIELAQKKIAVKFMYDSIGSFFMSAGYFEEMVAAGVSVIEYHPVNPRKGRKPFSVQRLFRRNHRKFIIVDSQTYYIGGMNIGERFLDWEDLMVRGCGAPVDDLVLAFQRVWKGKPVKPKIRFTEMVKKTVQVCDGYPKYQNYPIKRLYISAIKKSKSRVWISQAYFVPRRKLIKALIRAARRGVDVRVIVPDCSDVKLVDLATWPVLKRLLKNGVTIERYLGKMLHSKFAVIDTNWVTVGTANLDSMSLYWNLELNLVMRDPAIVDQFARIFTQYEQSCRTVDKSEPAQRPFVSRLLGRILYYYSWVL
jgi:cardiolipin synthase